MAQDAGGTSSVPCITSSSLSQPPTTIHSLSVELLNKLFSYLPIEAQLSAAAAYRPWRILIFTNMKLRKGRYITVWEPQRGCTGVHRLFQDGHSIVCIVKIEPFRPEIGMAGKATLESIRFVSPIADIHGETGCLFLELDITNSPVLREPIFSPFRPEGVSELGYIEWRRRTLDYRLMKRFLALRICTPRIHHGVRRGVYIHTRVRFVGRLRFTIRQLIQRTVKVVQRRVRSRRDRVYIIALYHESAFANGFSCLVEKFNTENAIP